jgi:hypothetical protein
MTLIAILLGTVAAGVGSVWLAAVLGFAMLARYTQHMLSLAAGALMATAFMHLLPEAFESEAGAHELFALLLAGLEGAGQSRWHGLPSWRAAVLLLATLPPGIAGACLRCTCTCPP